MLECTWRCCVCCRGVTTTQGKSPDGAFLRSAESRRFHRPRPGLMVPVQTLSPACVLEPAICTRPVISHTLDKCSCWFVSHKNAAHKFVLSPQWCFACAPANTPPPSLSRCSSFRSHLKSAIFYPVCWGGLIKLLKSPLSGSSWELPDRTLRTFLMWFHANPLKLPASEDLGHPSQFGAGELGGVEED